MKNRQTIIAAATQLSKVIAQAASIKIKERTPALANAIQAHRRNLPGIIWRL
jgi:hypothetical protein